MAVMFSTDALPLLLKRKIEISPKMRTALHASVCMLCGRRISARSAKALIDLTGWHRQYHDDVANGRAKVRA